MLLSTYGRAVFHLDVLIVETLDGTCEVKLRTFADAADLPEIPEDENRFIRAPSRNVVSS